MRMRPLSLVGSLILSLLATSVTEAGPRGKRAEPERGSPELRRQGDRVPGGGEAAELSKGETADAASAAWRNYYLVQLAADPLATYRGGVPGFAATSPQTLGTRKLEPQRPEVTLYRGYLARQQDDALAAISQSLSRPVTVLRRYDAAFNGFAI
ncbi:MAG: hypothetical protein H7X85_07205, partial [Thermoanaerobaculia bacterium]|nr:hypothetical protein [Thermoanaerobaculia bacterium]